MLALLEAQRARITRERTRLAQVDIALQQISQELRQWLDTGGTACELDSDTCAAPA